MDYVQPLGAAADASYVNGDPENGTEGSVVPAEAIEHPQREIIHVIEAAGISPDGEDLEQLYAAIVAIIVASQSSDKVTGDGEWTFRSTPKSGYIFSQGQTLGNTGSGADLTGTDYQALYTFYWDNLIDTYAPVSGGGRGESAAADWAANKTLTIPDTKNRAAFGVGSTWALGQKQGSETIAKENLPAEALDVTGTISGTVSIPKTSGDNSNGVEYNNLSSGSRVAAGFASGSFSNSNQNISISSGSLSGATTENMGSGDAFLPKGIGMNYMIKL